MKHNYTHTKYVYILIFTFWTENTFSCFLFISLLLSLAHIRIYNAQMNILSYTQTLVLSQAYTHLTCTIILDVSHYLPVGLVFSLRFSTPLSLSIISVEEMMVARDIMWKVYCFSDVWNTKTYVTRSLSLFHSEVKDTLFWMWISVYEGADIAQIKIERVNTNFLLGFREICCASFTLLRFLCCFLAI